MKVIYSASRSDPLRSNAARKHTQRECMSLESNLSTLFTYFIYIGMDAIIKT